MTPAPTSAGRSRLLPSPLLTLSLAGFWLLLNNTVHPAHVLLGLLLGWALPLATRTLCGPEAPAADRPAGNGICRRMCGCSKFLMLGFHMSSHSLSHDGERSA